MPCKTEIKNQITRDANNLTISGYNLSLEEARKLSKIVNDKYKVPIVRFNTGIDGIIERDINVPDNLIDTYYNQELLLEQEEARNIQTQDSDRLGLEQNDRYLFDDLPTVSNPTNYNDFNYANYISKKQALKTKLEKRKSILENRAKKSNQDLIQIEEIKEIIRKLNKDITNLKSSETSITNYLNYFQKDIDIISEVLDTPTLENIALANDYIETIKLITSTEEGGFLVDSIEEIVRTQTDTDLGEALYNLNSEIDKLESKFKDRETTIVQNEIVKYLREDENNNYTESELIDEAKKVYVEKIEKVLKEARFKGFMGTAKSYLHTADSSEDNMINKIMYKVFADSLAMNKKKDLREKLSNIKPLVVQRLKDLGHLNTTSFIGAFYNPVSYDIFKNSKDKLIQKFSDSWGVFKTNSNNKLKTIRNLEYKKDKDPQDYSKIRRLKIEHFELVNDNADFIDVTRLPELFEDAELKSNFSSQFEKEESIRESYKAELIAHIGEREYNRIVQEQKEKLYSFQIAAEQYKERLLKIHGVSDITDIPEHAYNSFLDFYHTKSPFNFSKGYTKTNSNIISKPYYIDGEMYEDPSAVADTEYTTIMPKLGDNTYFDQNFKTNIESDPLLYEAWEYMTDSLEFINQNGHTNKERKGALDNSLIHQRNMFQANLGPGKNLISFLTEKTKTWIKDIFSTSKFVDKNKLEINGQIRTISEVVEQRNKPLLALLSKTNNINATIDFNTLDDSTISLISEKTGKTKKEVSQVQSTISTYLKEAMTEKVANEQDIDLIESLLSQVEVVEKFKARREIETTVNFLYNKLKKINEATHNTGKKAATEIAKFFLEKQLYGVNNRANFNFLSITDEFHAKVYTQEENDIRDSVTTALQELQKLPPNPSIEKEIASLQKYLDTGGRVVTSGSLLEAVILKFSRFKAFALNFSTQVKNYTMGDFNALEIDGKEWTQGNYYKAKSYTRKWKSLKKMVSSKQKENYNLTTLLLNRLEVFQNSANEIFKVEESRFNRSVAKVIANPMQLPGEVEKTIQRPQILALLGDITIMDNDGNEVPIFDVNNLDNPHPAFNINQNGGLSLKPEFQNEENTATWIENNSQEYSNLFGDAGRVPRAIAYINGDYRDTSSYLAERTFAGAIAFMFKRWLPQTLLKKHGVYQELGESGNAQEASIITGQSAALYGLNANAFFGSMGLAVGLGLYATKVGKQKHKQAITENKKFLAVLTEGLIKSILSHQFYIKNARIATGGTVKAIQQIVNPILGANIISNDVINNIAGFNNLEGTQEEIEASKQNLQFLMITFSKTLIFTAMRIAIHSLLFPDDEEEEAYDTKESFLSRLESDPDTVLFYTMENTLSALNRDANMLYTVEGLSESVIPLYKSRTIKDLVGLLGALQDQYNKGDYVNGDNAGQNRVKVKFSKFLVPAAYDNLSLGFNNASKLDYETDDMISIYYKSDFKKAESNRKQLRLKRKKELEIEYKDKKNADKLIQKKLRKEFPTIKKYYDNEGKLKKENYKKKVDKYQ